jgi:hypothetical protein
LASGLGPGYYSPEKQVHKVKPTPQSSNFSASKGRQYSSTAQHDKGPGSYNLAKDFGHDSKGMTIGARRLTKQDVNPGHTPLDDDKYTRGRSPEHNFG